MPEDTRHIGPIVRRLREQKGIGVNALADEAEVDRGNLSKFERGQLGMTDVKLRRVAAALGIRKWQLEMLFEEPDEGEQILLWHQMREKLEPDQRAAAIRLFGHSVGQHAENDD